jgi:methyl-accepting chemotaxis protein
MVKLTSVSVRIMIAIALVTAAACAVLAGFSLWRQQQTVDIALERELRADYANVVAALDGQAKGSQTISAVLANIPEVRRLIAAGDRPGLIAYLAPALAAVRPLGIDIFSIETPPSITFARVHDPDKFGDNVGSRRKTVVQAHSTKAPVAGVEMGRQDVNVFGITPVLDNGKMIASMDIGSAFGDTYVKAMKERFGIEIAIHQVENGAIKTLASSLKGRESDAAAIRRAMAGEMVFDTGEVAGRPVAETYGPIKSYSGQPVAVVEIIRDTSAYADLAARSRLWLAGGAAATILLAALVAAWVGRGIGRPILALQQAMGRISAGDASVEVPGLQRRDEIGAMAAAVGVLKESIAERARLRGEQEQQRLAAENERRQTLRALADRFERGVGQVVNAVGTAAGDLRGTATAMAATAEEAARQTATVTSASEEATRNAQAVAAAIEELNASINEIAARVNESAQVAGEAATQASATNAEVVTLADAAQKIGDVVRLISEIAEQTNLLALNATIEAARAGEAGRGFAVVAAEVKALATQTSKATEDISAQVSAIQSATQSSVQAINGITGTIGRVNEIASAIASAVEEQGAATREIAHNVAEAARGTGEVSANIAGVQDAARETGTAASRVVEAATQLSENGTTLKTQVDAFLAEVRAA